MQGIFNHKWFESMQCWCHCLSCSVPLSCPQGALNVNDRTIPQPRVLQLSVEKLSREGAFLMDAGSVSTCLLTHHTTA